MVDKESFVKAMTPVNIVLLILVLFALGSTILPQRVRQTIKPDRHNRDFLAYALTLTGTLFVQPLLGFALLHAYSQRLTAPAKLAIVLVACSPGGAFSNVITPIAGANAALNASLTISEAFVALLLVPIGVTMILSVLSDEQMPNVANATAGGGAGGVGGTSEGAVVRATLGVVAPLVLGIVCAPYAERRPHMRTAAVRLLVLLLVAVVIVAIAVAGVPPVRAASLQVVSLFEVASIGLALALARLSNQAYANTVSMLFELCVRDLAIAHGVIFVAFADLPFAYQYEAAGTVALFHLVWNQLFLGCALLRQAVLACRRRRADADGAPRLFDRLREAEAACLPAHSSQPTLMQTQPTHLTQLSAPAPRVSTSAALSTDRNSPCREAVAAAPELEATVGD